MKYGMGGPRIPLLAPTLLLFAAATAVGLYYVGTKHDWATDRLQEIDQRYARLSGIEASRSVLAKAESMARAALDAGAYPVALDVSQAGNDAQRRVRDAFTKAGLQVMSSQVLAPKADRGFDRVPLSVRLEGDLAGLQAALTGLSALSPAVFIDGLTVQTIGAVRADLPQRLAVQLNLSVLRAQR